MNQVQEILKLAALQIGTTESPAGSNKVKYNTAYYGTAVSGANYPWCATFVWWLFDQTGLSSLFYGGKKTAYCPTLAVYYQQQKQWYTKDFKPGDIIFFDFGTGKTKYQHVGVVESVSADGKTVYCIEGNTSATNQDNGGAVQRRSRKLNQITGVGRPNYAVTQPTTEPPKEVNKVIYDTIEQVPDYGKEAVNLCVEKKWLQGSAKNKLNLSDDMLRMIVILHRAGVLHK